MATQDFDAGFYHKWFLVPVLAGEFIALLLNSIYCTISNATAIYRASHGKSKWDWEAFYPLRTILIGMLAVSLLSALIITTTEAVRLTRHTLAPGRLLLSEVIKVPIWIMWLSVVTLSFFNIIEKESLNFGIFALAVHLLGFITLFLPIPYAAILYVRDRRGYYGVKNSSGWAYEDGQWVPPEKSEENTEDTTEEEDTQPDTDETEGTDDDVANARNNAT
ncbi:Protein kinase byr2 [Sphaceloma murrayae]|uniref:Protein kinase byr2 n=1 Tax=Sphaceloma murrayae TaxID=2082308 RepID=A0A2K1QSQ2_9PEZI|nr:Protein kinase byr2 [Sphaceloma murrayae]